MKISRHFTYEQCIKSETAIRAGVANTPNASQEESMIYLCEKVLDVVKDLFFDSYISSFFRSVKVNGLVGGSATSQHCKGEAVDIDSALNNKEIFNYIKNKLDFDQLIWEFGDSNQPAWVHVSLKKTGNRKQVLQAKKVKGKTVYVPWQN